MALIAQLSQSPSIITASVSIKAPKSRSFGSVLLETAKKVALAVWAAICWPFAQMASLFGRKVEVKISQPALPSEEMNDLKGTASVLAKEDIAVKKPVESSLSSALLLIAPAVSHARALSTITGVTEIESETTPITVEIGRSALISSSSVIEDASLDIKAAKKAAAQAYGAKLRAESVKFWSEFIPRFIAREASRQALATIEVASVPTSTPVIDAFAEAAPLDIKAAKKAAAQAYGAKLRAESVKFWSEFIPRFIAREASRQALATIEVASVPTPTPVIATFVEAAPVTTLVTPKPRAQGLIVHKSVMQVLGAPVVRDEGKGSILSETRMFKIAFIAQNFASRGAEAVIAALAAFVIVESVPQTKIRAIKQANLMNHKAQRAAQDKGVKRDLSHHTDMARRGRSILTMGRGATRR